jgi:hypothetical protein
MDRRSFSKLLAGTVTTAGMHGVNAAESKPALQKVSMSNEPPNGGMIPARPSSSATRRRS